MTAREIAQLAADLVGGERVKQHGPQADNFENAAVLFSAYFQVRLTSHPDEPLNGLDYALLMVLSKIARTLTGTHNPDDYVDMCGYAAGAGAIADLRADAATAHE